MKKLIYFIAVIMLCAAPVSGAWAASFIYANSYEYTPNDQPPRYWEVGVTSKPPAPPLGIYPEYALGAPNGLLTGWSPEQGALILGFGANGLANVDGDEDLTIWHFGKPDKAYVYVSTEKETPVTWTQLGALANSPFGTVAAQTFGFGELNTVFFVKIDKKVGGNFTGHYIDAVGAPVPIPGSILLLGSGIIGMFGLKRKKEGNIIKQEEKKEVVLVRI